MTNQIVNVSQNELFECTPMRTIGLNVQVVRTTCNKRFKVIHVLAWNNKQLVAECGSFEDAVSIAYTVKQ